MSEPGPDRSNVKTALGVAAFGLLLAGLSAAIALRPVGHAHVDLLDKPAPAFVLPLVQTAPGPADKRVGLADFAGKPLLVHFWAPSCPPCVAELPQWQALYEKTQASGEVAIVTVAGDDWQSVRDYLRDHRLTLPTVLDATGQVHKAWQVDVIPSSYAVSATGRVVKTVEGAVAPDLLAELVAAAKQAK